MNYSEKVLDHFRNPRNMGKIDNPDGIGIAGNTVCLHPKTKIHTRSSILRIRELKPGEKVLSHNGDYHKIKSVSQKKNKKTAIKIKNKFGETILTPDHLVLSIKLPKGYRYARHRAKKQLVGNLGWHHASELKKGDILAYPIPQKIKDIKKIDVNFKKLKYDYKSKAIPKEIQINNDFLRLSGYFLAEGHISEEITSTCVGFSFNSQEKEYINNTIFLIKKIFGLKASIYKSNKRESAVNVCVNNVAIAMLFKQLFNKGAQGKFIPEFMMFLPLEKQKDLILGMWRGDGFFSKDRKEGPRGGYATISPQIAEQLKILLLRQGIIPSIYKEKEKIDKNGVNHKKAYRIHVGERDSVEKLAKILRIKLKKNKKRISVCSWIENDYAFFPATKVENIVYSGNVHNLEVEKSKSFTCNSLCVHNCGDLMHLYIKVENNIISDISFETFGCAAAISTSSMITEIAKGKTLNQAIQIKKSEVVEGLDDLPPIKVHCSILATDALAEAIYDYLKKNQKPISQDLEKRHQRIKKEREIIEERYEK